MAMADGSPATSEPEARTAAAGPEALAPEGRAVVDATLGAARRMVAFALASVALILVLVAAERAWFLRTEADALDRVRQAEHVASAILLADEQLTMSAYMAAATGEERWIARYFRYVPDMEAALARGEALAPSDVARRFHESSKAASDSLMSLETTALDVVRAPEVARAILDGERYRADKARLTQATQEFTTATMAVMRDDLDQLRQRSDRVLLAMLFAALGLGALTWKRLSWTLKRSREVLTDAQWRIQRMAMVDALTGLPNRAALHDGMAAALARAARGGTKMSILMIDLDSFKPVNDRHGHLVGDRVLKEAAGRMDAVLRGGEMLARFGGDEFVALIDEGADVAGAYRVAERIIAALSEPMRIDSVGAQIGASIGIARFPDDAQEGDELLRRADLALYRAKSGGRGRACHFDPALDNALAEREKLEGALRLAIERGHIVPHYQPVVDLADRHVRGVELLARWQDPDQGLRMPSEFIPLAERAGLIGALTMSMLRRACEDMRRMPAQWRISVNIAPEQIQGKDLVEQIVDVLRATRTDPRRLEVELTETALVADVQAARRTIEALKRHGITVALDDFGTGYSSLSYLSELPFDKIKIDRSFVATLHERHESVKIVQSIIGLGASLGVQVVAEGVETERDARTLAGLSCNAAQGYLFARPMALDALLAHCASSLATPA
jgi:diguanylate cyclase (GGDEF)-like protein